MADRRRAGWSLKSGCYLEKKEKYEAERREYSLGKVRRVVSTHYEGKIRT